MFNESVITNAGRELIVRAVAKETEITFTKVEISSTVYQQSELAALESLTNVQDIANINATFRIDDTVRVEANVTNNTDTSITCNTIGYYAKDDNNAEILFSAAAAVTPVIIAPAQGLNSYIFRNIILISGADNYPENFATIRYVDEVCGDLETGINNLRDDAVMKNSVVLGTVSGTYPSGGGTLTVRLPQEHFDIISQMKNPKYFASFTSGYGGNGAYISSGMAISFLINRSTQTSLIDDIAINIIGGTESYVYMADYMVIDAGDIS